MEEFTCSACGENFSTKDNKGVKRDKCPKCGGPVNPPSSDSSSLSRKTAGTPEAVDLRVEQLLAHFAGLDHESPEWLAELVELTNMGKSAVPTLVTILKDTGAALALRDNAATVLTALAKENPSVLTDLASVACDKTESPKLREGTLYALVNADLGAATPVLRGILADEGDQPLHPLAKDLLQTVSERNPVTIGCFFVTLLMFLCGAGLLLFRPAEWGIPGIVPVIIAAIGLSGICVGWPMLRGK